MIPAIINEGVEPICVSIYEKLHRKVGCEEQIQLVQHFAEARARAVLQHKFAPVLCLYDARYEVLHRWVGVAQLVFLTSLNKTGLSIKPIMTYQNDEEGGDILKDSGFEYFSYPVLALGKSGVEFSTFPGLLSIAT